MTSSTPTYGLPFEVPGDRPGVTLSGGPTGTEADILAEAVETELARIDSDVSDANAAIVEAAKGWVPIVESSFTGTPPFEVDLTVSGEFPAGTFSAVRIRARGSLVSNPGHVTMRINNDTTSALHDNARIRRNASDGSVDEATQGDGTIWRIGYWGTLAWRSNLECVIFHTGGTNTLSYQSESTSLGSTGAASFDTKLWGALASARLLDSLRFSTFDAASDFSDIEYQIEGWVGP